MGGPIRKKLVELEDSFLVSSDEIVPDDSIKTMLAEMKSSTNAFVVFHTERERDLAIEKSAEGSLMYEGCSLKLSVPHCEPTTVLWQNFDGSSATKKTQRLVQGICIIFLALLLWATVFYGPYAWSIFNFNYDNGMQPGMIYGLAFTMVVVVGNTIMYAACAFVSESIGFRFRDDQEAAYLIMYACACTLNVVLDMVTQYFMSWSIMSGLGFRTYEGGRLEHMEMFPAGFETYAMQRNLAESVFAYGWPSTFLIPFLIEPIATITGPLLIGKLLVRSNRKVRGTDAEDLLLAMPMDLGRYGDCLLNVIIFIFILYFPGGYTAQFALFLALSHVWIYVFDQYKVLRVIPNCTFASYVVDWWAQAMFAPCCGLILSVLVFKSNNTDGGIGMGLVTTIVACTSAFALHTVVHILALLHLVPKFGIDHEDEGDDTAFSTVAQTCPSSWFNTNPIHCLRSKFVYKHSPPCIFYSPGKEDLMEVNDAIGCHFYKPTSPRQVKSV